jgi:hypothetical protein
MRGFLDSLIAAAAVVLALAGPVRAQDAPDAQSVITRQLDAFAHDDAQNAFDQAAPEIRAKFATPEAFLAMVKSAYPAVYRHRSVQFGAQARDGAALSQGVTFVDADNDVWKGVYTLTHEADGAWKITGCAILKSDETSL